MRLWVPAALHRAECPSQTVKRLHSGELGCRAWGWTLRFPAPRHTRKKSHQFGCSKRLSPTVFVAFTFTLLWQQRPLVGQNGGWPHVLPNLKPNFSDASSSSATVVSGSFPQHNCTHTMCWSGGLKARHWGPCRLLEAGAGECRLLCSPSSVERLSPGGWRALTMENTTTTPFRKRSKMPPCAEAQAFNHST